MKHKSKPIWGIQFHPEYDNSAAKMIINSLKDEINEEGLDPDELLKGTINYSEEVSKRIMSNFLETAKNNKD